MRSLKQARTESKLTLEQASELTGVTATTLNNVERGVCAAQRLTRNKCERVFGMINWLDTSFIDTTPRSYNGLGKEVDPWLMAESSFRTLVHEIMALGQVERQEFCRAAQKHLHKISNNI